MKLTESQLRSIIRKELQEMMTPEFGEDQSYEEIEKSQVDKLEEAFQLANSLQEHLAGNTVATGILQQLVMILDDVIMSESAEI
jgi:cobalamin biosynthesis protein CobT